MSVDNKAKIGNQSKTQSNGSSDRRMMTTTMMMIYLLRQETKDPGANNMSQRLHTLSDTK